uniref:Uncharacterized protein n=1 Tax=Anguilla anguilla TaxID=7936 RepID=A0A0E9RMH8_ANGAN
MLLARYGMKSCCWRICISTTSFLQSTAKVLLKCRDSVSHRQGVMIVLVWRQDDKVSQVWVSLM